MRWLVRSSLRFRRLVVALAAGLLVLGIAQIGDVPVDMLPEFDPVQVEVQTEALGLSAAEVEQLITVPLEQDLLNGVAFLETIESTSLPGLSSVILTFEPGTPVLAARQVVQERLTQAHALPQVSQPPQMLQPVSSTSRVAMVRLTSNELDPIDLSVLARWSIRPRLMGVDGVANVSVWGMRDRQLQVLVDPDRLRDRGVTLQQVVATTANALWWCPLTFHECSTPGVGGFIDGPTQRLAIHHESPIETAKDLARVPLEDTGDGGAPSMRLGDVARVVEDHPPLTGDAVCREAGCLLLVIEKLPGANTLEVTRQVEQALDVMRPGLGDVEIDASIYRPATYIERSFAGLGWALLIGSGLMLLVVVLLTWSWRRALIVGGVVALSLTAAFLVLVAFGTTVNLMIVAGLAMALAAIVDDGVVEADEDLRRLSEQDPGQPVWRGILDATLATRTSMLFATLIMAAVVVPAFFLEAEAGAFIPSIVTAYLLAVGASMLVALTVTPVLGVMLLPGAAHSGGSPLVAWLSSRYDAAAPRIVLRPAPAVATLLVVLLIGAAAVPFLEASMRPRLKEGDLLIGWEAEPGSSLTRMHEITADAVAQIEAIDGVDDVGAHVGRALLSDQIVDVNAGQIWVHLGSDANRTTALASIEDVIVGYHEISSEVRTYAEQRITDVLQRSEDDLVVRVYGEDAEVLGARAQDVRAAVAGIDGVTAAEVMSEPTQPTLEITVDLDRAERFGVKPGDVRRTAAALLAGIPAGALFEEQKVFDVVVWGEPRIRESERDVEELLIDTPGGRPVRLAEVADVRIAPNLAEIHHESVMKYVDVTAEVTGRDVGAVAAEVELALAEVPLDLDYHAEVLGGFSEEQASRDRLVAVAIAALLAVLLLLQAALGSWRVAVLAFVVLPMSLVGGVLAMLLVDGTVTLGGAAGLAAVFGLAARQVVLSIRRLQRASGKELEELDPDAVLLTMLERLPSIVTSSCSAAVLLAPFAVLSGAPGFEVVGPMATVILGGLVTTALLSLVVLPALYLRYGAGAERDRTEDELTITLSDLDQVRG